MTPDDGATFWRGPLAAAFPAVPVLRELQIVESWDTSGGGAGGVTRHADGSVTITLYDRVATYPVLLHEAGHGIEGTRAPREREAFMTLRGFPTWDLQADRQREEQLVQPPRYAPNGTRLVWHISPAEKYAEGFRRAAQHAGLVPFDSSFHGRDLDLTEDYGTAFPRDAMVAHFQALRSEDMAKFISGDLAIVTDDKGNASKLISVSGLEPGVPAFGIVQRIGLAGDEASLPDTTFQVDLDSAAFGRLHVRNDPVRNGTAYYRVAAIQ